MNYLSLLPVAIVAVAALAFTGLLAWEYKRANPGPIDVPTLMTERRIRAFNRRLALIQKRRDHE